MAVKENIEKWLSDHAESMGFFPVETEISSRKVISVYIDSMKGITVQDCSAVSRSMSEDLGTQLDAYSLVVSSAGLDRPLTHPQQFIKNEGKEVEVLLKDGQLVIGSLVSSSPETITVSVKPKGKKEEAKTITLDFTGIKEVKLVILFK